MEARRNLGPAVSVVVPTYNEAANILALLTALDVALTDLTYEAIVVDDDSPDRTWKVASEFEPSDNGSVVVIRRTTERGLSSAVIAGMDVATGDALACIDADLQHDESILPAMVESLQDGVVDICVGSRRAEGGGFGEWSKSRLFMSWVATSMARLAAKVRSTDPMSGFFVLSRSYYERTRGRVNPRGFKILLEFLVRGDEPAVAEVGYTFRERTQGETKLSGGVVVDYVLALIDLRVGRVLPPQMVKYFVVGTLGILVNLLAFMIARLLQVPTSAAVLLGIQTAAVWNYVLNNRFTFAPFGYRGLADNIRGFAVFIVVGLHGLLVQLAVFELLRRRWPFDTLLVGGSTLANAIAIFTAAVGNYFLHRHYTWDALRRRSNQV